MIKVRCPICDREMESAGPARWPRFPFCSARCQTIDLGRWLGGSYRLPVEDPEETGNAEEMEIP
jgi:endogenous inhibitor of DNA gyrase (YacG/DUF329 family)